MPKSDKADQNSNRDMDFAITKSDIPTIRNDLKTDVDAKKEDVDSETPVHCVADNENTEIMGTQLENGCETTSVAAPDDARRRLISRARRHWKAVDVLLQQSDRDKVNEFLNAKSSNSGNTALHLAAKCGAVQVVKSLLRHGATFDSQNIEGIAPAGLTKNPRISHLLQTIEKSYESAKNGDVEAIKKMKSSVKDDAVVLLNCRNNQGHSLIQCAIANGHADIADLLLKMMQNPESHNRDASPLKKLIRSARRFLSLPSIHLDILRSMVQLGGSEKNAWPWKTLKEGSYYLENVYRLIEGYKISVPDSMCNKYIRLVNETLMFLEFDPKHISSGYTKEAYGEKYSGFTSKGQGTRYYKLLHSNLKKDVKTFIRVVDKNIIRPLTKLVVTAKPHYHSELHQLRMLKKAAEFHLEASNSYLPMLGNLKQPLQCTNNPSPSKTLQNGSNYLEYVNRLVKCYLKCAPGPIENPYIKLVKNTLVELEFDPDHHSAATAPTMQYGVSRVGLPRYYKLLHTTNMKDVRQFLEIVEINILEPVKMFLNSINQSLQMIEALEKTYSALKTKENFAF